MAIDGRQLLTQIQAAAYLSSTARAVQEATRRGNLTPVRDGGRRAVAYVRADLDRYKKTSEAVGLEALLVERYARGMPPVDAWLEVRGMTLKQSLRVLEDWATAQGLWLVEGPPGSYQRWLSEVGVLEVTPTHLRRVIEAMLADPHTAQLARVVLDRERSRKSPPVQ